MVSAMSPIAIVLLVAAVAIIVAAEWPRLSRRLNLEDRRRRQRRRKAHLRVVHPAKTPKKIYRRPTKHKLNFDTVTHNLSVFPKHIEDLVKNIFK